VRRDARAPGTAPRSRHVDRIAFVGRQEAPERRRRAVAEDGAVAAGQERRGLASERRLPGMAHREDALVHRVQATRAHPVLDRAPPEPGSEQLRPAHPPSLHGGDPGNALIHMQKCTHVDPFET